MDLLQLGVVGHGRPLCRVDLDHYPEDDLHDVDVELGVGILGLGVELYHMHVFAVLKEVLECLHIAFTLFAHYVVDLHNFLV